MMQPCTSINVFFDASFSVSVEKQIERCAKAGFRHLDMNFWDWSHSESSPFTQPDWRNWVKRIAACAENEGIVFTQAHAHVSNFFVNTSDSAAEEQVRRSIEGAGMLGIPWIVVHPAMPVEKTDDLLVKETNLAYFTVHAERAAAFGTGIAIENMTSGLYTTASALAELIDGVGKRSAGACWDTGHANLTGQNQKESLTTLGNRLHALHIADNNGLRDEHVPPFFGNIDWREILLTLREIGYDGDFTYEAHNFVRKQPDVMKDAALHFQSELAEALLNGQFA